MRRDRAILLCCVLIVCLAVVHLMAGSAEEAAIEAAESWLAEVDSGEYAKSWDQSSTLFRNAVSKKTWEESLNAARKPFGDLVSRKLKSAQFASSLPGAPDGEYVVIQFAASFENKENAVETITPMKDPDGKWRVSGYFIK